MLVLFVLWWLFLCCFSGICGKLSLFSLFVSNVVQFCLFIEKTRSNAKVFVEMN